MSNASSNTNSCEVHSQLVQDQCQFMSTDDDLKKLQIDINHQNQLIQDEIQSQNLSNSLKEVLHPQSTKFNENLLDCLLEQVQVENDRQMKRRTHIKLQSQNLNKLEFYEMIEKKKQQISELIGFGIKSKSVEINEVPNVEPSFLKQNGEKINKASKQQSIGKQQSLNDNNKDTAEQNQSNITQQINNEFQNQLKISVTSQPIEELSQYPKSISQIQQLDNEFQSFQPQPKNLLKDPEIDLSTAILPNLHIDQKLQYHNQNINNYFENFSDYNTKVSSLFLQENNINSYSKSFGQLNDVQKPLIGQKILQTKPNNLINKFIDEDDDE